MDQVCRHCRARYFRGKVTTRMEYSKCCAAGKVHLPPLKEHPQEMQDLFSGNHPLSREFKQRILYYNNCFQFVSIQTNLRNIPGYGPYVYAIQGKIYHHISDVNVERANMNFGPVYFLDPAEAVQQRVNNAQHLRVNPAIIEILTEILHNVNPYARQYRQLRQVYEQQQRGMRQDPNVQMPRVYIELIGQHRNRNNRPYDLPEVDQVAAVVNFDENNPPNPKLCVFLTDRDNGLKDLNQESEFCDPLNI